MKAPLPFVLIILALASCDQKTVDVRITQSDPQRMKVHDHSDTNHIAFNRDGSKLAIAGDARHKDCGQ